jgi:hypothetical protein
LVAASSKSLSQEVSSHSGGRVPPHSKPTYKVNFEGFNSKYQNSQHLF